MEQTDQLTPLLQQRCERRLLPKPAAHPTRTRCSSASPAMSLQYDGQALIAEYDASGVMQKRYVHGPGNDEPLVEYGATGNRTWLHADERGSVIARTNSSGATTTINSYDEYGVPDASNVGRFGYTGQTWLPSLGLWYCKARMYLPRLCRFNQEDPVGYSAGLHLYGYVGGDPLNLSDSSQLCPTGQFRVVLPHFNLPGKDDGRGGIVEAPAGECVSLQFVNATGGPVISGQREVASSNRVVKIRSRKRCSS